MTVKQRLIDFIKYKKMGQKKFAQTIGMSDGYVNAIRVSIQPDTLHKIAMQYPELNTGWLMTGNGDMLNPLKELEESDKLESPEPPYPLELPKLKERKKCYGGGEVIEMPREVFDQIAKLTETILSQQRVIESQSGVIETLVDTSKKMVARPDDNVICADASGSGIEK